jgi:DNA-binding IclR family transcriptional regulator
MLQILDLIEEQGGRVSTEEALQKLGFTRSTLYRYLKTLSAAGLITSLSNVGYTFGPRIAELDYEMRNRDPLIIAAKPVMAKLVQDIPGVALLCRRYRDRVLCVHQEAGDVAFTSAYQRGLARPISRGAASRIILAYLPARTIAKLYEAAPHTFVEGELGHSLAEVKAVLKKMRARGFDVTTGHGAPGVTGIAAPVFDNRGTVLGSLSLTLGKPELHDEVLQSAGDKIQSCAQIVTDAVGRIEA